MRSVNRLKDIPGFSIDQVALAAGSDPEVLRLENLDTDLRPLPEAIQATQAALLEDDHNSYLPFTGRLDLRTAVAERLHQSTRQPYDANNVVITCGATEAMLDTLLATTDPGDEVVLTDPTYAGMINRVRLVGAIPRLVPFYPDNNTWRLDLEALKLAINEKTKAIFIMNPSMPSGAVLNLKEWEQICTYCKEQELWLIYNAAMERILFDSRKVIHPAALADMYERTITIGSVSKEYCMIGWRIGWIVAPKSIINDIGRVHIYNAVTPTGIAQPAAAAVLNKDAEWFQQSLHQWEARRNMVNEQLKHYAMVPASGGWSQLVDVSPLGIDAKQASKRLLEKGKVAVTPMTNWGAKNSQQFIRIVFSNETVGRLSTLQQRFKAALG